MVLSIHLLSVSLQILQIHQQCTKRVYFLSQGEDGEVFDEPVGYFVSKLNYVSSLSTAIVEDDEYQVSTNDYTITIAFDSSFDVEDRVLHSLHGLRHAADGIHDKCDLDGIMKGEGGCRMLDTPSSAECQVIIT